MLGPDGQERAARAVADLRIGLPVAVGPVVLGAVETLSPGRVEALGSEAVLAITARRAATLRARIYDGDLCRIAVPAGVDAAWLRAVADPAGDLRHPMKGPLRELRGGDAAPWRTGLRLAKAAHLLPAVVGAEVVAPEGISRVEPGWEPDAAGVADVASARVPTVLAGAGRLHVVRDPASGEEHCAFEAGRVDRAGPVLVRLHSACFTGDILGSLKCDCGPQLHAALEAMRAAGSGMLLYLNQEGRGIGLANKMRAYDLQDQGFDTVEANHRLGFEDDERDFRVGAALLRRLGVGAVRLMTNNPRKVAMMEEQGIAVAERVPLRVGEGAENAAYLAVKRLKSGHLP